MNFKYTIHKNSESWVVQFYSPKSNHTKVWMNTSDCMQIMNVIIFNVLRNSNLYGGRL